MTLELHTIASYSSMRLIDSLAEGIFVGLFAAVLLRFARRQNAGTRFAIGFSALLAIALLPLFRALSLHNQVVSSAPALIVPESWAVYLFSAWAVIVALLLARVGKSIWHLQALRNACVPIDLTSIDPSVAETLKRRQSLRKVVLCTSEKVRVPTALGLIRPAIVIPQWVLDELPAGELNQVVLHELAHLRRWDDWTNLAQQIVKALFFFHPAVWWIEKKIAFEREMACDDAVLAETGNARSYAECLAHLAERSFLQRSVALAQALVGRIAQTSQRVAQILDVNRPKGNSRTWKPAVSFMVGVGFLCSVWAVKTPELVGFENEKASAVEFAHSMPDRISVPVTNAALFQRSLSEQPLKPIPAKLNRKPAQHVGIRRARAMVRTQNRPENLVHLSAMKSSSIPVSQAVLIFIESGIDGPAEAQIYRVQMWHVTVLQRNQAVGSKTPSPKT
ncbi:MAG TPA: M56 family metallopeptidase [Candidatus Sulfotelmatobacter sp.]|nr:M56 family metallopeptidase [Candidatus Sulfotelmatobacter sp.]